MDAAWRSSHGHHIPWIKPSLHTAAGEEKVLYLHLKAKGEPQSRVEAVSAPSVSSSLPSPEQEVTGWRREDRYWCCCRTIALPCKAKLGWVPRSLMMLCDHSCFSPFPGPYSRLTGKNVHVGAQLYQLLGKCLHWAYVETLGIHHGYRWRPQGPGGAVAPHYNQLSECQQVLTFLWAHILNRGRVVLSQPRARALLCSTSTFETCGWGTVL